MRTVTAKRCNIRNESVLISIRPEWCNLIADGKKTVEVRKTRPKLETPFKCYIKCEFFCWHISELKIYDKPLKIGEFRRICRNDLYCESCAMYSTHNGNCGNVSLQVRRPPQSWCYVKEGVFGA